MALLKPLQQAAQNRGEKCSTPVVTTMTLLLRDAWGYPVQFPSQPNRQGMDYVYEGVCRELPSNELAGVALCAHFRTFEFGW